MNRRHTVGKGLGAVAIIAILSATAVSLSASTAFAQEAGGGSDPAAAGAPGQTHVTLELRDAPMRTALEQLFKNAKVDYVIDNDVAGFVTMKVTDLPFEQALRLMLRSGSTPLSYVKENNAYIVRPRKVTSGAPGNPGPSLPSTAATYSAAAGWNGRTVDRITLTYMDPYDSQGILGTTIIPVGTRGAGSNNGLGGIPGLGSGSGFGSGLGNGLGNGPGQGNGIPGLGNGLGNGIGNGLGQGSGLNGIGNGNSGGSGRPRL